MQAFSADHRDYIPLVNELGLMYQVLDDYLNLQSTEYHHNKSFCEDLTEGKYSFPVVHSVSPLLVPILIVWMACRSNRSLIPFLIVYVD